MLFKSDPSRLDASRLLERIFAVASLLFFSGALIPLLVAPGGEGTKTLRSDPYSAPIEFLIYSISGVLVLTRWRTALATLRHSALIWSIVALALASCTWSIDPGVTRRAALALVGTMVFASWFADRFSLTEQASLLACTIGCLALASLGMALLNPSLGVDRLHTGAWRGVFEHKNSLGRSMALGVAAFAVLGATRVRPWLLYWAGAMLCLVLLILSTSKTALVLLIAMLAIVAGRRILRSDGIPVWSFGIGIVAALALLALLAYVNRDVFLQGAAGGEDTLTGRTLLWGAVAQKIMLRPWLGYGHQAFWNSSRGFYVDVWQIAGWAAPHSHNGFLDVALDFGLPGLVFFLGVLFATMLRSIALARITPCESDALWPVVYLSFLVIANLTETSLLRHGNIYWILFASAGFVVNRRRSLVKSASGERIMGMPPLMESPA